MSTPSAEQELLVARARRLRARGEVRKMLVTLREACMRDETCAWLWSLYGAMLAQHGKTSDAAQALKHAVWLRRTAGDRARAKATQALLDRTLLHAA